MIKRGERWGHEARTRAFNAAWESEVSEGRPSVWSILQHSVHTRLASRLLARAIWDACWEFCKTMELHGYQKAMDAAKGRDDGSN